MTHDGEVELGEVFIDPGDSAVWYCAACECRLCGCTQVLVFPEEADDENLQCGHCENMSAEAKVYYGPDELRFEVRKE